MVSTCFLLYLFTPNHQTGEIPHITGTNWVMSYLRVQPGVFKYGLQPWYYENLAPLPHGNPCISGEISPSMTVELHDPTALPKPRFHHAPS